MTGTKVLNVDHNDYFNELGRRVASHLGLDELVEFKEHDASNLEVPIGKFDNVFSFAAHQTDDGGLNNNYTEHFGFISNNLGEHGRVFFETHCADVDSEELNQFLTQDVAQFGFKVISDKPVENSTRRLIILER